MAGVSSGIEKGLMDQYSYLVFGTILLFIQIRFSFESLLYDLFTAEKPGVMERFFFILAMTSESTKMSDSQV